MSALSGALEAPTLEQAVLVLRTALGIDDEKTSVEWMRVHKRQAEHWKLFSADSWPRVEMLLTYLNYEFTFAIAIMPEVEGRKNVPRLRAT